MSALKTNAIQLGENATATQNFTLRTNNDGTLTLARGNVGATTQDLLTADAAGVLSALGKQIFTRGNILGTVSQLTGNPTGALMEYGSNANGEYWRYAGGQQLCTRTLDLPGVPISTQANSSGPWAAAFTAAPSMAYSVLGEIGNGAAATIGLVLYNGVYSGTSATAAALQMYSYRAATDNTANVVRFYAVGVGRWY